MKPTLSVFIPNYNHGHLIGEALAAVLVQSWPADEVLVIDDGSTDNSVAVIEQIAQRQPSIRLVRNEQNRGVIFTEYRGYRMVTGDYVFGASADDYILPGFFENAMAMAQRYPQAGIICGNFKKVDSSGNELFTARIAGYTEPRYFSPQEYLTEYLQVADPLHSLSTATIYRRECLLGTLGYHPELGSWADTFTLRAIGRRYGAVYIPEVFAVWRQNQNSFAHAICQDPANVLDLIARAAYLMRTPPYRDLFPSAYVDAWECAARKSALRGLVSNETSRLLSRHAGLWRGLRRVHPLGARALTAILKGCALAATCNTRRKLSRYQGDISCYC